MNLRCLVCLLTLSLPALPQSDARLGGEYRFQTLALRSRAAAAVDAVADRGSLLFDGGVVRTDTAGGAYQEDPGGVVRLGGFTSGFGAFDARLSAQGEVLLGKAAPESGAGMAFLVAIRKPATFSPASFQGTYQAVLVSFPASGAQTPAFGAARFAASQASLTAAPDGTGTLVVPASTGISATRLSVATNQDASWIIGQPVDAAGLFVAVRTDSTAVASSLWVMEIAAGQAGPAAAIGAIAVSTAGRARIAEQWLGLRGQQDYRGEATLTLKADGSGTLDGTPVFAAGGGLAGGVTGISAGSILLAVPTPSTVPSGVFANPLGEVSAASFSPAGDAAAPGQLRSLFGANLAVAPEAAQSLPLPVALGKTSILAAGRSAPLLFVSPQQVNYQTPPDAAGPYLAISARNDGTESDPLLVRIAATSPAVFSLDGSGGGSGIFTHADFSLVTAQSSARPNEIVIAFLTGLGSNQPLPRVRVGGLPAEVLFAGPAPGFAGLDQLNFRIPSGVAAKSEVPVVVGTREGWSDTVTISIAP